MGKRDQRWPVWKIVAVTVGFTAASVGFFVGSRYVTGRPAPSKGQPPVDPDAVAHYTMGNMLILLGALSIGMVLICIGWLVVRYTQSIPEWKKRAKLPPHKRK
jgi:hypothetical protein